MRGTAGAARTAASAARFTLFFTDKVKNERCGDDADRSDGNDDGDDRARRG